LQKEDYSKKFGAYQKTILHFAAINGNLDVLEEILKHKEGRASLSIKDDARKTPLHYATENQRLRDVECILDTEEGIKSLEIPNSDGNYPIHSAAAHSNIEILKKIIEKGGEVQLEKKGSCCFTPLYNAVANQNYEIAEEILKYESGKNSITTVFNMRMQYYDMVLKYIVNRSVPKEILYMIIDAIIELREDVKCFTSADILYKNTPIHSCLLKDDDAALKKMLQTNGGKQALYIKNNNRKTPIDLALERPDRESAKYILNYIKAVSEQAVAEQSAQQALEDDKQQEEDAKEALSKEEENIESVKMFLEQAKLKEEEAEKVLDEVKFNEQASSEKIEHLEDGSKPEEKTDQKQPNISASDKNRFLHSIECKQLLEFTAIAAIAYTLSHTSLYSASPDLYKIAVAFIVIGSVCKNYACRSENDYSIIPGIS
ncbi:MAG: ankyrin repeat domain-containing protein, partial [Alphaproteobacteria bacterium]